MTSPVKLYAHWTSPPTLAVAMVCEAAGIPVSYHKVDLTNKEHLSEAFLKLLTLIMASPVKLYAHWISPPTLAVAMVCEAAGIPVTYQKVDLAQKEHLSEAFLKINPDHCLPTIDDNGFILWESRAIARYLMNKYAPNSSLYPQDLQQRALVDRMLDFELSVVQKTVFAFVLPQLLEGKTVEPTDLEALLQRLNDTVFKNQKYAAGDVLTLPDIFMMTSLILNDVVGYRIQPATYPNLIEWMKRIKAAEFYKPIYAMYKQAKEERKAAGAKNII